MLSINSPGQVAPNMAPPPNAGMISFTSNEAIDAAQAAQRATIQSSQPISEQAATGLAGFVRNEYQTFKRHRDNSGSGWSDRLLSALRMFNGQYDPSKLQEIAKFGGSQVYGRLVAGKVRGASSLLRDVYLNSDRPWGLIPPSEPEIPVEVIRAILTKVQVEVADEEESGGQELDETAIRDRTLILVEQAKQAAKRKAQRRTKLAEDKLDDLLQKGGFYKALSAFLADLPLFPFACIKGPTVQIVQEIDWINGKPIPKDVPRLTYNRISPFDIWFTPGVADIKDAAVIERIRMTRADLNQLLDLPGYNKEAIENVLRHYGPGGYVDDWDGTDSARADLESRENPQWNQSRLITCYEYHGNVQGLMLLQSGMDPELIDDPLRDYAVEAWIIGAYTIKVQLSPSPRRRHPYWITSFEKVPGTPVGNALPDMLCDFQEMANNALRNLANNMSMSSGPQVVVREDLLSGMETGDDMYPWKRWRTISDPTATSSSTNKPIEFFQPASRAQEFLGVYKAVTEMADDASAIPRYLQGNSPGGGAGRTASGLAMLMGNASKILQTVAANVDNDVIDGALHELLDLVLLTDETDMLDGTENVVVKGVAVAMQRETQRSRQLELLQITANPMDYGIMGPNGRATLLRNVSNTVGMPGEEIVPSEEVLQEQQAAAAKNAAMTGQPGFGNQPMEGQPPGGDGGAPPSPTQDMGPRLNNTGASRPPAGGGGQRRIAGGVG